MGTKLSDNNQVIENLNAIKGAETMQDFFKQQAKWLSTWQEQQQKLTEQYASWGEDLTQGVQGAKQEIPTNFEELLKSQQELFEQFTSFGANLQQNIQQIWGDKLPTELLRQFNFNILQEFYKSWLGNMKFPGGLQNPFMGGQGWPDPSSFLNNIMKQDHPFLWAFNSRNLTDELQQLFGLLQGAKVPGGDLYSQLFTTYQGFFNQLSSTGTRQGFDKLLESFTRWKEQTDQYLLAPQIGINRESAQDFSKSVSLSFDYLKAYAVMGKLIEETARKSGNRFQAKLVKRSLNNEPPIKFSDFCSLWTKENEPVFLEVFGSEVFAKTQREFTSAGLRLKMQINKLVEKVLDQTPIALKRDVDLAAGEILQLKRELRKTRKQQQELAAETRAAKLAVAAGEKRFQALEAALAKVQALEAALVKVQALAEQSQPTEKAT
ncbi:MAG: poly(R)-hydroxyalkanoic acid synthase subunit PhaE, partial [Desulfuromonadales bacterium]